jgi:hypothetical protein
MKGMAGTDPAPTALETVEKLPPSSRSVQCVRCGHVQEFDPDYAICLNCGSGVAAGDTLILAKPRTGRGMQGLSTFAFLLFLFVFFFWSKYIGRHGMAVSALFYIWGFYRNYLYKREAAERLRPTPGAVENNGHLGKP